MLCNLVLIIGQSPSWFLRSILAIEEETNTNLTFVCDSWLAVESPDGQIEKTLQVAEEKDLKQFHLVFASTVSKNLFDGHIWFSVFMRPKASSFTRVRRLSACLSLIFLIMLTNAMFFGAGDAPGNRKIIWLGNFKINFTGIMIGIQSSIIIIPPSVIIIEIFRRLAPKKSKMKSEKAKQTETPEGIIVQEEDDIEEKQEKKGKKKKDPCMCPNQCQYLAYFIVFGSVLSSAVVCFFYSMMWGPRKSNEWLASMFTGFFQSVLVIQPFKAVCLGILFAVILRKPVSQEITKEERTNNEKKKKSKEDDEEGEDLAGDDGIITADEVPIIRYMK